MADAPVTDDFLADVTDEAAYQRERWGETHDADKDDSFWFWTLGHIVGKVVHDERQTVEKQRHRLRAGAALLLNWDRHIAARHSLPHDALMLMERGGGLVANGETDPTVVRRVALRTAVTLDQYQRALYEALTRADDDTPEWVHLDHRLGVATVMDPGAC